MNLKYAVSCMYLWILVNIISDYIIGEYDYVLCQQIVLYI